MAGGGRSEKNYDRGIERKRGRERENRRVDE